MRLLPTRRTVAVITTAAPEKSNAAKAFTATRAVVTHVAFTTAAGWASLYHRAGDAATHGAIRWEIRDARAREDHDRLDRWVHALEDAKVKRAQRLAALPRELGNALLVGLLVVLGAAALVVVAGLVAAITPGGMGFTDVLDTVGGFIGSVLGVLKFAFAVVTYPLVLAGIAVVAGYREGTAARAAGEPNSVRAVVSVSAGTVTESTIAKALAACRLPALTKAMKDTPELEFTVMPGDAGRGRHAVVALPDGVTAAEVIARRDKVAAAMRRSVLEVDAKVGSHAGELDLWVANPGALAAGPGPHPFTIEMPDQVDIFDGVPLGRNARGDVVNVPVIGRNFLVGGAPEQGKSTATMTIAAAVARDPRAELWIFVCAMNSDFDPFEKRASKFHVGRGSETVPHLVDALSELKTILDERGRLLKEHGIAEVNTDIAGAGVGLHPLLVIVEEAQIAFRDDEHGDQLDKDIVELIELCRKCGVILLVSTQAPTAASIPTGYKRQATMKLAFHVSDQHANNAILGDGAYTSPSGRATELRAGQDRGTCIAAGLAGDQYQLVQVFYLGKDGLKAVLKGTVAPAGAVVPPVKAWADEPAQTIPVTSPPVESEDSRHVGFLGTVLRVMGDYEDIRASEVARMWAERGFPALKGKGAELKARLEAAGVAVPAGGNVPMVRARAIRERMEGLDGGQFELDEIDREALAAATRVIERPVRAGYDREESPVLRVVR